MSEKKKSENNTYSCQSKHKFSKKKKKISLYESAKMVIRFLFLVTFNVKILYLVKNSA